jgi:hypothetical protein
LTCRWTGESKPTTLPARGPINFLLVLYDLGGMTAAEFLEIIFPLRTVGGLTAPAYGALVGATENVFHISCFFHDKIPDKRSVGILFSGLYSSLDFRKFLAARIIRGASRKGGACRARWCTMHDNV